MFLSMCIHLVKHLHPIWWNVSYYKSLLKMKRDHFGVIHLIRGLSDVICEGLFICLVGLIPRGGQVFSFVCDSISTGTSGQPSFSVNWGWHHFMDLPIAPTCNLLSCFQNSKFKNSNGHKNWRPYQPSIKSFNLVRISAAHRLSHNLLWMAPLRL